MYNKKEKIFCQESLERMEMFKIQLELRYSNMYSTSHVISDPIELKKYNINLKFLKLFTYIYNLVEKNKHDYSLDDMRDFVKDIFDNRHKINFKSDSTLKLDKPNHLSSNLLDDLNNIFISCIEYMREVDGKDGAVGGVQQFYFSDPSVNYEVFNENKHFHFGLRDSDCEIVDKCIIPTVCSKIDRSVVSKSLVITSGSKFMLEMLPLEITVGIINHLEPRDLFSFSLSSHKYRGIISKYSCWSHLFSVTCPEIYKRLDSAYHQPLSIMLQIYQYKPSDNYIEWLMTTVRSIRKYSLKISALKILLNYSTKLGTKDFMKKISSFYHDFVHFSVSTMQDYMSFRDMVLISMELLLLIFKDKQKENIKLLVQKKIHIVVLFALKKYESDPEIQFSGCCILYRISRNNSLRPILASDGILDVLNRIMKFNFKYPLIMEKCCELLRNLAFNDELHKDFESKKDVIKSIIKVLRLPNMTKTALVEGCIALNNICQKKKLAKIIYKCGGVKLLCDLLSTCKDVDIKCEVINNFTNLAYFSLSIRLAIYRRGGVDLILKEMRDNPNNETVQNYGYSGLNNLSFTIYITKKIAKSGAIELLAVASNNFPQNADKYNHLLNCLVDLNNGVI